jgi:hypothetical protein
MLRSSSTSAMVGMGAYSMNPRTTKSASVAGYAMTYDNSALRFARRMRPMGAFWVDCTFSLLRGHFFGGVMSYDRAGF